MVILQLVYGSPVEFDMAFHGAGVCLGRERRDVCQKNMVDLEVLHAGIDKTGFKTAHESSRFSAVPDFFPYFSNKGVCGPFTHFDMPAR